MNRSQSTASFVGRVVAAILAFACLLGVSYQIVIDNLPKTSARQIEGYTPWSEATLKIAEAIPVQSGGRIKPFSSYAGFTMYGIHGARSMKIVDGQGVTHKLRPTAWMLDTIFRPQLGAQEPSFRIDNSEVLKTIGAKPLGRRDRYSYAELAPSRAKLIELAQSYEVIDSKKRETTQQQILDLAQNLVEYETLLGHLHFVRGIALHAHGAEGVQDQLTTTSAVMQTADLIHDQIEEAKAAGRPVHPYVRSMVEQALTGANAARSALYIFPPQDQADLRWRSAGELIDNVLQQRSPNPEQATENIRLLEKAAHALRPDAETTDLSQPHDATFLSSFKLLSDQLIHRAKARGEYNHIAREAAYYRSDYFLRGLVFFLIGTVTALPMWAVGRNRIGSILAVLTWVSSAIGLGYCVFAIVQRCIIMERPPVGNLYDTVVFIAASGVALALIVEWMTRRRFALGLAPIVGTLLIVLARRYEIGDAKDHMDPLVAVLRSNYWLTTHVITITLGYAAGLVSALISCGYVLLRGLGLVRDDRSFHRMLTRAVYGCLCLTLFLSLTGTVLGGVWANDSWGRFWGWDPKENGALMIVLWTLAILHARLGGFLREWGLHLASIFTACIVAFSWWHVNFLGVGLHNYGFTAGKNTIWAFYSVMCLFLLFGFIAWAFHYKPKKAP